MDDETTPEASLPQPSVPSLAGHDVFVYALVDGGICLQTAGDPATIVSLPAAERVVRDAGASGAVVHVGGDDAPLSVDALARLGTLEVPLEAHAGSHAPLRFPNDSSSLLWAAGQPSPDLIDDLIDRGADLRHRDAQGNTALHHAALAGNTHAVEALVAAGADVSATSNRHLTALDVAQASGNAEIARHLAGLIEHQPVRRFALIHGGVYWFWLLPPVSMLVLGIVMALNDATSELWFLALVLAPWFFVCPPLAFWVGGAPRSLEGTTLVLFGLLGRRELDLSHATLAATGGAMHGHGYHSGRWLVLAHPDGRRASRSGLRRLLLTDSEKSTLAERDPRLIVVTLDGMRRTEVLGPVTAVLSEHDVELLPTVRRQAIPTPPLKWWQR